MIKKIETKYKNGRIHRVDFYVDGCRYARFITTEAHRTSQERKKVQQGKSIQRKRRQENARKERKEKKRRKPGKHGNTCDRISREYASGKNASEYTGLHTALASK